MSERMSDKIETAFEESFPDLQNEEWWEAMQEAASLADSMIYEKAPIKEPSKQSLYIGDSV